MLIPTKVPEDLQSILSDPSLFQNPSDITTKEILKRYGDIGANGGARHQVETTEAPSTSGGRSNKDRAQAPVLTRVDSDTAQNNAWQKESSVRHVQNNAALYGGGANSQNTHPDQWQHQHADLEAPSPYTHRNGSGTPDSQHESRRDYRNSGWGRPSNGGTVPVSGAS